MRKICVVTGTRAEYGLLYWLMREIQEDLDLQLQLIVTGMHLSPEFGLTYQQIEQDGFKIDEKVEMLLSSDTAVGMVKSLGLGIIGFADALDRLKPDFLLVLGDRYEILAAAQSALLAKIPIAHISGGERTEGAIDEAIRHSITKMAHLHFPEAEEYRNRVIQLGEQPERVFAVGTLCLENIRRMEFLSQQQLEVSLAISLEGSCFLITYHPTTLSDHGEKENIEKLLAALDDFPTTKLIFTESNADSGGRTINQQIRRYCQKNPKRTFVFTSLGSLRYLSLLQYIDVVVGNSSSGITEVPFFHKPTVNIGARQTGRLQAESIIDCEIEKEQIVQAIQKAVSPQFQKNLRQCSSPYGQEPAAQKIKEVLKQYNLENILMKSFYDLE